MIRPQAICTYVQPKPPQSSHQQLLKNSWPNQHEPILWNSSRRSRGTVSNFKSPDGASRRVLSSYVQFTRELRSAIVDRTFCSNQTPMLISPILPDRALLTLFSFEHATARQKHRTIDISPHFSLTQMMPLC